MRKLALTLCVAAIIAPSLANAQVEIDMGTVTCGQYLAMGPDAQRDFSAWMSGWFNQKKGFTAVDLEAYKKNVANVQKWCTTNPKSSVMGALQASTGGAN